MICADLFLFCGSRNASVNNRICRTVLVQAKGDVWTSGIKSDKEVEKLTEVRTS
jgi:hypothetical protein